MLLGFATTIDRPAASLTPRPVEEPGLAAEIATAMPAVRIVIAAVLTVGRDHADVEDAASETMRRAVEGRCRLRAGEPVRPWLIGIARHVALDARRTRSRAIRRAVGSSDAEPATTDQLPSIRPDPFEQLASARRDARVREAVARLPDGSRQALTLFHLEGLGYDEIAARLAVPMGTVATWISRGRRTLQGTLAEEGIR
jgi:RNA polymerase sigma factor (sigma-70 family)